MKRLFPVILALFGLGGGLGAGLMLAPDPPQDEEETAPSPVEPDPTGHEYVRLENQFIVPIVDGGRISAMVILTLSIEAPEGSAAQVRAREPKLRDAFLQVLFDHANSGGFSGNFTTPVPMESLRNALREAAQVVLGPTAIDVLIVDMLRQDS